MSNGSEASAPKIAAPGPNERVSATGIRDLAPRLWAQWKLLVSVVRLKPFDAGTADGRSLERYRRIALTMLSSLAVRGVGTLTGLVSVPLVLAYLGKERYGLWSAITTVVAWMTLFDFGVASGVVNCVSRANGRDDREAASRYVSTALALLVGIAAVLGTILALGAGHVPWSSLLAARGVTDDAIVTWAVVAALGVFIVGMPLSVVPQIYAGYQKTYVANAFALIGLLGSFAALIAVIKGDFGMPALIVAFGAGTLIASALGMVHAMGRSMPWLRFRASAVRRDALRGIVSLSAPLFLFQVAALLVNETQSIILAHRCDLSTVAEYTILIRLYQFAMGLIQASTAPFIPSFREAWERGDHAWMRSAFRRFVWIRVLLATAAGLAMVVLGNWVLRVWLRRSDVSFTPMTWGALAVMMIATTRVTAHSDLMTILDRLWVLVLLAFVNGVVTVGLTYWLSPSLRVMGVVVATGAVTVVVYSWLLPWMTRSMVRGAADAHP
jgi:O-antigen/teichoic acid export membrane protein